MPQMAPMMWQTIYISCMVLTMIILSKTFFLKINLTNNVKMVSYSSQSNQWKW